MQPAQFSQTVIGHTRELGRLCRWAQQFERRIGERQYLLIITELIKQPQAGIEVP